MERAACPPDLTPAETARLHRLVLETALDGFILMDQGGRILDWNPEAEWMFGWSRADVLGRRLADTIIPPSHRPLHEADLERFLATGEGRMPCRRVEVRARRHDGGEFPVELTVVPICLDNRWLFSCFVHDVSERRQSEEQIQRVQKMEAVAQLTGGVAHDFNNLLTVVIGGIDLVMDRVRGDLRAPLESALHAAERGAVLVQRLLAFSRRQTLLPEPLDINRLVEGMRELLHRTLGERIEVEFRLKADLWHATADKVQLESALLHLAINARDAMPKGGRLLIETRNGRLDEDYAEATADLVPGDYVMVAVSDTGTGMAPEIAARAVEPFFTTKGAGLGGGLGLSMVYGFVKQSEGHLKIYSEVGHGTTVRLYLPRAAGLRARPEAVVAAPATQPHGNETILVVEDDDAVRSLVVSQLRGFGYRVLAAADGPQAEKIVDGDVPIDLLFTDIVMPGGLTGPQLVERAQARLPTLKALFTTGYTENAIAQQGVLGPHAHLLSKPYRRNDLARKVREVLDAPPLRAV